MPTLAAFGCSHTDSYTLERVGLEPKGWPEYLGELLNMEVFNGGRMGMSNQMIARNLALYLSKGNKPDLIVVELTDWARLVRHNRDAIEDFELGEYASIYPPQWIKSNEGYDRSHDIDGDILPYQEDGLATLAYIQALCGDIPLIVLNYHEFGKAIESPLWNLIDTNNLMIENHYEGGWMNHLAWCGFDCIDKYHFGEEALRYTADRIAKFYMEGELSLVEKDNWWKVMNLPYKVYDYTNWSTDE